MGVVLYFFALFNRHYSFHKNEFKNVRLSLFPKDIYISETMEDGHFYVQNCVWCFHLICIRLKDF